MQRSLVLLAFTVLLCASSSEARRLWQFGPFGGTAQPAAAATTPPAGGVQAQNGAGPAMMPGQNGGGIQPTGPAMMPGAGGAGTAPTTATAVATSTSNATAPGATAQPAVATAAATGTPDRPGAAVAAADTTRGVTAGATGAAVATAAVPGAAVAAEDEEAEAPAPVGPKVLRPGVYVIADPPPPPKVRPAAVANVTAARNVTAGPPMPAPGKNLMVVMTVMGQQARDIYKNQKSLRGQVADAAGVGSNQVFFYNQTTNQDPRTGVTAMSLIMNVDCESTAQCAQAGVKLFNSSTQTRLTDSLARNSISMLPGTFQVYGVQQMGRYKGNETLYENKALTAVKPKTPDTGLDYNATLARVFAGMNDPQPAVGGKKPAGALPGDIPLAGTPGLFGNFSIPTDNMTLPQSTFALPGSPMGNGTLGPMGGTMLPADLPGLVNETDTQALEPAARPRSSAGSYAVGALPLLAAAAAVLLL